MPYAAPKACTRHPEVLLQRKEKCPKCKEIAKQEEREYNRRRRNNPNDIYHFYQSKEWRECSATHRAMDPHCEDCLEKGVKVKADHVDHIIPIDQGGKKFARKNLRSLCKPCHSAKTMRELNRKGVMRRE